MNNYIKIVIMSVALLSSAIGITSCGGEGNDETEAQITGKFTSPIIIGEVPKFTGAITSPSKVSSIKVSYTPPKGDSFDGSTYTLLECPKDPLDHDCSKFIDQNSGVTDLAFISFDQSRFQDVGEYPITIYIENDKGKNSSKVFNITVIPKVDSVSVSPKPVDVEKIFKLSVSGQKLTTDVKAYVVGGSECGVSTPTNGIFVELDCTANKAGKLTWIIYYKDKSKKDYELKKGQLSVGKFCTPDSEDTQSCPVENGNGEKVRACAVDGSKWGDFASCQVAQCNDGYHKVGNACVVNPPAQVCTPNATEQQSCSIANGTGEKQRACAADGLAWGGFGNCQVAQCNDGYHIVGNACVVNPPAQVCTPNATEQQSCSIANGTGEKQRACAADGLAWGSFGNCQVSQCNAGYHQEGNTCVANPPQVCEPNATEAQSCIIENGSGEKLRLCAADGSAWGNYGSCQVTRCSDWYKKVGNSCVDTGTGAPPENLVAGATGPTRVWIQWTMVADAIGYNSVLNKIGTDQYLNWNTTNPNIQLTGTPGDQWRVKVRAEFTEVFGLYSEYVSFTFE